MLTVTPLANFRVVNLVVSVDVNNASGEEIYRVGFPLICNGNLSGEGKRIPWKQHISNFERQNIPFDSGTNLVDLWTDIRPSVPKHEIQCRNNVGGGGISKILNSSGYLTHPMRILTNLRQYDWVRKANPRLLNLIEVRPFVFKCLLSKVVGSLGFRNIKGQSNESQNFNNKLGVVELPKELRDQFHKPTKKWIFPSFSFFLFDAGWVHIFDMAPYPRVPQAWIHHGL